MKNRVKYILVYICNDFHWFKAQVKQGDFQKITFSVLFFFFNRIPYSLNHFLLTQGKKNIYTERLLRLLRQMLGLRPKVDPCMVIVGWTCR